jgi:hypothetical protein
MADPTVGDPGAGKSDPQGTPNSFHPFNWTSLSNSYVPRNEADASGGIIS